MPAQIQTLQQLKDLASKNPIECFINLKHGAKSSKTIQYFPDGIAPDDRHDIDQYKWDVFSSISDEYLEIEDDCELAEMTHIVEAIELNALFLYSE